MKSEKIIQLWPPSTKDDLMCKDGEIVDGEWLNPQEKDEDTQEPSDPTGPPDSNLPMSLYFSSLWSLDSDIRILTIHQPCGKSERTFVIMQREDGMILYRDTAGENQPAFLSLIAEPKVVRCVGCGPFLVFLTYSTLLYARWNSETEGYDWLGGALKAPLLTCTPVTTSLQPYSYSVSDLPQFEVTVGLNEGDAQTAMTWLMGSSSTCPEAAKRAVKTAVTESLEKFLLDVSSAGLYLHPLYVKGAWCLENGKAWMETSPLKINPYPDYLTLAVVSASADDAGLYLKMEVSRAPFSLEFTDNFNLLTRGWKSIVKGVKYYISEEVETVISDSLGDAVWINGSTRGFRLTMRKGSSEPESLFGSDTIAGSMTVSGAPDELDTSGSRLFALHASCHETGNGRLIISEAGLPMVSNAMAEVSARGPLKIIESLRTVSSGQFGEFPLYLFSSDGIRVLSSSGNNFREVQLITRDIALSLASVTPLPQSVAFISPQGVAELSGTSISLISSGLTGDLSWKFSSYDRLAYLYTEDTLILYTPGKIECRLYGRKTGKWRAGKMPSLNILRESFTLWPKTFFSSGFRFGTVETAEPYALTPVALYGLETQATVTTRPLKFGAPFALKKLKYIEILRPDGLLAPLKVYGAIRLGHWYPLGYTESGRMALHGSGWRFFKIETTVSRIFPTSPEETETVVLPLIRCIIET